jgi:hypothetical protein
MVLASKVEVNLKNSKKAIKAKQEISETFINLWLIGLFKEIQKIVCSKLARKKRKLATVNVKAGLETSSTPNIPNPKINKAAELTNKDPSQY